MADQDPVPLSDLIEYYTRVPETTRLTGRSTGELEFVRTQELILRHLPPPPADVLDVGGGTGAYSLWLASLGYAVQLIDSVPLHVDLARQASVEQLGNPLAGTAVGDARALQQPDASIDAVLLLGPLYHLTERPDRQRALREALRVLRRGGVLFVAAVSRFAPLLDGLRLQLFDDHEYFAIVDRGLRDGQHRNTTDRDYWTTAYLHRPDEFRAEVAESGFVVEDLLAVEGPRFAVPDLDTWWSDPVRRDRLLGYIRTLEREPTLIGMSGHILAIGTKA